MEAVLIHGNYCVDCQFEGVVEGETSARAFARAAIGAYTNLDEQCTYAYGLGWYDNFSRTTYKYFLCCLYPIIHSMIQYDELNTKER